MSPLPSAAVNEIGAAAVLLSGIANAVVWVIGVARAGAIAGR
jgi:hypothetical protein